MRTREGERLLSGCSVSAKQSKSEDKLKLNAFAALQHARVLLINQCCKCDGCVIRQACYSGKANLLQVSTWYERQAINC